MNISQSLADSAKPQSAPTVLVSITTTERNARKIVATLTKSLNRMRIAREACIAASDADNADRWSVFIRETQRSIADVRAGLDSIVAPAGDQGPQ